MGKRVVGRYFLDHVLADGVHACIYLFTVDMEMEPLPGFRLTSWERGLRRHEAGARPRHVAAAAVAAEDRARVLRRLHRGGRADRGGAALGAPPAGRAGARHGLPRADRVGARALPVQGVLRRGARQALPRPHARCRATSRTTTSSRPPGKRGSFAPSATTWRRRACPWSSRRASGDAARRRSTCATPRRSRWPTATCSTSTASRRSRGRRARR